MKSRLRTSMLGVQVVAYFWPLLWALPKVASGSLTSTTAASSLQFTVTTSKADLVLYEPVVLRLELQNPLGRPVTTDAQYLSLGGDTQVYVVDPNGVKHLLRTGVQLTFVNRAFELGPKEKVEGTFYLLRNDAERSLAFPAPGTYRIGGTMIVARGEVPTVLKAREVEVRVEAPAESDRCVIEKMGSPEAVTNLFVNTSRIYCEGKPTGECIEHLRSIIDECSTSAYAPFVEYDLAVSLGDGLLKVPQAEDLAIDNLEHLLKRWPRHALRGWVFTHLAILYDKNGNPAKSERYKSLLEKEFPGMKDSIRAVRKNRESSEQ